MYGKALFFNDPEYSLEAIAGHNVCLIKVDLPDPDTPVIQINFPNGIMHLSFFRSHEYLI